MIRVLVLGGGLQGLSTARSLRKNGYEVVVASSKLDVTYYSKYVSFFVELSLKCPTNETLTSLCSIIKEYICRVVIPMSDTAAEFLSVNKLEIERLTNAKCAIDNYSKFVIAYSKKSLLELCEQHSIPHPKTVPLTADNLYEVSKIVSFPALIKPDHSVGARGITLVNNIEELKQKFVEVENVYGTATLQTYIDHKGRPYYNVMLYRNTCGIILSSVIFEIKRYYPVRGGSSSYGETIESPELLSLCSQVLNALNWYGFADFDVLKDENGKFLIIEMNPRVPASLRAAAISGVNFPEIIVNDVLGLKQKNYLYTPGKKLRYLGLDIMWFIASSDRFITKPSWFHFFGKDIYYQEGGLGDIRAMLYSLWVGLRKIFSSNFRKSKSGIQ